MAAHGPPIRTYLYTRWYAVARYSKFAHAIVLCKYLQPQLNLQIERMLSTETTRLKRIPHSGVHRHSHHSRDDPREIALRHASIIQHRKDIECQILENVILLSGYPTQKGPEYSACKPADIDTADFKAHVRLFQPGDFDDLIEERNANLLCGYALCPNPKPAPSKGGPWKLINVGKANFDIVDRGESERWCSDDCKRRALYVKLQLSETAAWERAGFMEIEIELLGEGGSIEQIGKAGVGGENNLKAAEILTAVKLEQGVAGNARMTNSTLQLTIQERYTELPRIQHSDCGHDDENSAHLMIEGYKPGRGKMKEGRDKVAMSWFRRNLASGE
ncbi:hypothetical protein ACRALDRAFT_211857 [Sodiomyces alcalophilus JCM 7366]|uniref:uncharacterized protein n=1 Tax=Sodiomyces alcalophilus JCM 7366 TaxID=591952 RepID=UPI0039B54808